MPASTTEENLVRLIRCTERMLDCADAADWDSLEMLERERNDSLQSCFDGTVSADQSAGVSEAIAALLSLNDRLVQRVAQARSAVMDELAGIQRGRSSQACYSEIQGLSG